VRHHHLWKIGAAVLASTLALTACGNRDEPSDTNTSDSGGNGPATTVTIGVIAPLTGDLSALGLGIKNSVDLAINQANESGDLGNYTIKINAQDDQATPDVGQHVASLLADDDSVIGVVGTLNSSVAQSVAPVLSSAGIVQVSPANTATSLTQGEDFATAPQRVWDTYFRTATTDANQAPFAAVYVHDTLGITEVATINDQKTYGAGLAQAFEQKFTDLGGTITSSEVINPDEKDYSAVVAKVAATNPKLVYYGGEYPQAAPLSAQMASAGLNVPLMGGDGIYSGDYLKLGGRAGDLATSVGAPVEKLASAGDFVSAYQAAGYSEPYEAYGGYAYDSANAIIEALKAAIAEDNTMTGADLRAAVLENMASVNFQGATGTVSFDEFGDTTNKTLTVYKVADDLSAWNPEMTGEYEG